MPPEDGGLGPIPSRRSSFYRSEFSQVGTIRVRTLAFRLDGDLEAHGLELLSRLLAVPS